jgi:type I restriction enzyme S subunit
VSELPSGWVRAPLDAIADVLDHEREPINSSEREARISGKPRTDLYTYYGATGQVGLIDSFRSDGQRVLLGEDAAPFLDQFKDKAYLANGRFWVNNHAHVLAGAAGLVDNRFLCFQLNAVDYHPFVTGSTRLKLTSSAMKQIPMAVAPAAEQIRIVEKLEELLSDLDAGVAELKAAQKKLAQYRQSLLKAAVEGALTAEWRQQHPPAETGAQLLQRILTERRARWEAKQLAKFKQQGKTPPKDWQKKYPEPVQPDTNGLPDLPQGWVWASVDQCSLDDSAITDGPFGSNLKSSHYQASGPRVIRLQNIGDGVFVDAMAHIAESHYSELFKHAVQKDDLAIAMLGEILPRACIIPSGVAPAIVKADCARVRVNKCLMQPALLAAQLNSKPIRDAVVKFVKGIGRPRINLGHIRAIPIALCSIDEQSQLEAHLFAAQQAIDRQNEAINLSLKQSSAQRQNILRAAFSGHLVPQDHNDEPASVLLARIRAERAERDTLKTPRRSKAKEPA